MKPVNANVKIKEHSQKVSKQQQIEQICLCINKIINWSDPFSVLLQFYAIFVSPTSGETILERKIDHRHNISLQQMSFKASMKINYTSDQKIIHLTISKRTKGQKEELGTFQIDLQQLKQKKKQYYPFGLQDQVLQICQLQIQNGNKNHAEPSIEKYHTKKLRLKNLNHHDYQANQDVNIKIPYENKHLINRIASGREYSQPKQPNEKIRRQNSQHPSQKLIRDINNNRKFTHKNNDSNLDKFSSASEQSARQQRLKKSFSQKVQRLLKEVKAIRQNTNVNLITQHVQREKPKRQIRVIKTDSAKGALTFNNRLQHKVNVGQINNERRTLGNRYDRSSKAQMNGHQLNLANLNIIESEYYSKKSGKQQKQIQRDFRDYHQVYY